MKVFETVAHGVLITTFDFFGVSDPRISWLLSCLTSRRFFTVYNAVFKISIISSPVSQNGIPSLQHFIIFIMYINECGNVFLFINGYKIFFKRDSPTDCLFLKLDLNVFFVWTEHVDLNLNVEQFHKITFCWKHSLILHLCAKVKVIPWQLISSTCSLRLKFLFYTLSLFQIVQCVIWF